MPEEVKQRRKLRVRYHNLPNEYASIETARGFYVCEVQRCSDEGRTRFRQRVRQIQAIIEQHRYPIITTSPDDA